MGKWVLVLDTSLSMGSKEARRQLVTLSHKILKSVVYQTQRCVITKHQFESAQH